MLEKIIKVKEEDYQVIVYEDYGVVLRGFDEEGNPIFKTLEFSKKVFDASYDAETNTINPENLAYVEPTTEEINAQIQAKREQEYKKRSDSLYMAWQKYLVLGEEEKASEAKALWLAEVEKINEELPYKIL